MTSHASEDTDNHPRQTPRASQAGGSVPRCVASVQPRRGHGVTVATYYLARALAARGIRTLVMDLTGRRGRLSWLATHDSTPGLTVWAPHIPQPERMGDALARARAKAAGKVDAILLDVDAAYLEAAGGIAAGIDYALIFIEHTEAGMREADHLAARLDATPPPQSAVGAVLTRVSADNLRDLPPRTPEYGLPIVGELPADYLLATSDDYSLKDGEPHAPHDAYTGAVNRLAQTLISLTRMTPGARRPSEQAAP